MKTAPIIHGLAVVAWVLAVAPASAQRVQFATPVTMQPPPATPGAPAAASPPAVTSPPSAAYAPPATSSPYPSPTPTQPSYPTPSMAAPTYPPPTAATPLYATPSPTVPSYPAPPAQPGTTYAAPTAPGPAPAFAPVPAYGTPPPAAFNGTIQPPPPTFDPYATPGVTPPSPLLQQDPYFQGIPGVSMGAMQKFLQRVDLDYEWFAGNGDHELGINDVNLSATFAFPLFSDLQTPLLVTPGFAVHYWSGPVSVPPTPADMPPRTYDAYLDAAWNPQITSSLGAELEARVGVYSDFTEIIQSSIRVTGKGEAVITFSPSIKIKAGVWYLDRVKIKLLPAGGIVWTPTPDIYFDILFPNPKVARRLTTWGNTEWWLYASGEYGGGTWTIKRESGLTPPGPVDGQMDTVDYNDIRIAAGLEFKTYRQLQGYFEVGFSCSRELVYQSYSPNAFYPNNTVYLGAGLAR